ncbi:glycoside hydrolase family 16 protein [Pelagicoccus sp. SDUM812002]|uniref:glycoside hydrolase family 16 protein n=1 Tax=Pelagicoccus sp. SDUM812002 TaxID=3041266 RepID=UPI00280E22A6|nr:glycoside hydrolase family 16 protein [Pelagicoccus sp. SDUM812002]MDQ8184188.1 glycoside hydrolase family 16 protein [Pelagicoccus sp. SDUM812002]
MKPLHIILTCFSILLTSPVAYGESRDWHLIFADEFETDGPPNPDIWSAETGFSRNEELQWYQLENAQVKDGHLVIEAKKENISNPNYISGSDNWKLNRPLANYTSACLKTYNNFSFQYGKLEVKARIPDPTGMWPAIWTLGDDRRWPACGEIDIMEFYLSEGKPTILANAAWPSASMYPPIWDVVKTPYSHFLAKDPEWGEKFHIWTMEWNSDSISISLDDEHLNTIPIANTEQPDGFNPFHQPHYILLNLAIGANGGSPSETSFPQRYEIDYVRVYQLEDNAKSD